jgi:hypothetical protein
MQGCRARVHAVGMGGAAGWRVGECERRSCLRRRRCAGRALRTAARQVQGLGLARPGGVRKRARRPPVDRWDDGFEFPAAARPRSGQSRNGRWAATAPRSARSPRQPRHLAGVHAPGGAGSARRRIAALGVPFCAAWRHWRRLVPVAAVFRIGKRGCSGQTTVGAGVAEAAALSA